RRAPHASRLFLTGPAHVPRAARPILPVAPPSAKEWAAEDPRQPHGLSRAVTPPAPPARPPPFALHPLTPLPPGSSSPAPTPRACASFRSVPGSGRHLPFSRTRTAHADSPARPASASRLSPRAIRCARRRSANVAPGRFARHARQRAGAWSRAVGAVPAAPPQAGQATGLRGRGEGPREPRRWWTGALG